MSAISGITSSAESIQVDYLNLLMAQLQNQNPLEPMSSTDMTSQLAQISQLERLESIDKQMSSLENIDSRFQQAMLTAELNEATALIGKTVSFFPANSAIAVSGKVDGVNIVDGAALLNVGEYNVKVDDIMSISE